MRAFIFGGLFFLASVASADMAPDENQKARYHFNLLAPSALIPPSNLELYSRPYASLSESQQWRMRIHGLRYVMLDPKVWGTRLMERTENRQVIPMKPFVLRSSESPSYRLRSLMMNVSFRKFMGAIAAKRPHDLDALLEIGLAGEVSQGEPGKLALVDRGYVVRLSSVPSMPAGLYYRSLSTYELLQEGSRPQLPLGKRAKFELQVNPKGILVLLDGVKFIDYKAANLDRGLLSLRSGWYPTIIKKLEVQGEKTEAGKTITLKEGGVLTPFSHGKEEPTFHDKSVP